MQGYFSVENVFEEGHIIIEKIQFIVAKDVSKHIAWQRSIVYSNLSTVIFRDTFNIRTSLLFLDTLFQIIEALSFV